MKDPLKKTAKHGDILSPADKCGPRRLRCFLRGVILLQVEPYRTFGQQKHNQKWSQIDFRCAVAESISCLGSVSDNGIKC